MNRNRAALCSRNSRSTSVVSASKGELAGVGAGSNAVYSLFLNVPRLDDELAETILESLRMPLRSSRRPRGGIGPHRGGGRTFWREGSWWQIWGPRGIAGDGEVFIVQQLTDPKRQSPEFESLSLRQFLDSASVIFSAGHKQVSASFARNAANTSGASCSIGCGVLRSSEPKLQARKSSNHEPPRKSAQGTIRSDVSTTRPLNHVKFISAADSKSQWD